MKRLLLLAALLWPVGVVTDYAATFKAFTLPARRVNSG
jgi:hypothetical protein